MDTFIINYYNLQLTATMRCLALQRNVNSLEFSLIMRSTYLFR